MPMSPRLLRPRQTIHPEAADWANRVRTNGGSVSGTTLSAVDRFVKAIHAAGIRDRFYRLNLFCGDQLAAALVPLYRAESLAASVRGNATDTNNNFVSADFNNTGSSSGLTGNGTSKFLNTGINANSVTASNCHMGAGIAGAATGAAALRVIAGAFNNAFNALLIYGLDIVAGDSSQTRRAAHFSRFATLSDGSGPQVNNSPLGPGNVIAAHPNFFINGVAHANIATTSQDYPSAHSMYVFALNNSNSSALGYFNGRLNWYSFGLTMTSAQAAAFNNAVTTFNSTLLRT